MFNQGDNVVIDGLNVARRVAKNNVYMNMDGFNSDEDEVHVKDEVHVREGKTT